MPRSSPFRLAAPSLILAAAALPAFAFQPFVTDDTGTQGTGGNQLEFSHSQERATTPGDVSDTRTLGVTFTRGVTDELDLFVQANRRRLYSSGTGQSASGSGNPSFGAKWRFYENADNGLSLGLKPEVIVPVGAAKEAVGLGTGRTSYGATLIVTQEVAFGAVHANLLESRERYRDTAANPNARISRFSVAPVWDVTEQWKVGIDLGTETRSAGIARTRANFVELGAVYAVDKNLDLALGFVRNTATSGETRTTNSATLGVTWRF